MKQTNLDSLSLDPLQYASKWGRRYHFDNSFDPLVPLSMVKLRQVGEIIAGDDFEIYEHFHECVEISYVVSGEGDFYTDDTVFHAKEGDIHLVSPGQRHKIVASGNQNLRMAYIAFLFYEDNKANDLSDLIQFYTHAPSYMQNEKVIIKAAFEQLLSEIYMAQDYSNKVLDAFVTQIIIQVYRIFKYSSSSKNQRSVEEVRMNHIVGHTVFQALRFIDSHIEEITSVSQIAEHLKYNPTYLSRIFRERTGLTLSDYLVNKKIETAKSLLEKGLSVNDTAERLNYASSQSFCKMFQRNTGCTPTEYKKNC